MCNLDVGTFLSDIILACKYYSLTIYNNKASYYIANARTIVNKIHDILEGDDDKMCDYIYSLLINLSVLEEEMSSVKEKLVPAIGASIIKQLGSFDESYTMKFIEGIEKIKSNK